MKFQNITSFSMMLQEMKNEPITLSQDVELFNAKAYKEKVSSNIEYSTSSPSKKAMKTFLVARKFGFLFNTQIETTGAQPNYILPNFFFWFRLLLSRASLLRKIFFIFIMRCRWCRCGERKVQKHVAIARRASLRVARFL